LLVGCFTRIWDLSWRVSDWWHYLMEHIGRNASNYFMY
jgi:hypothetical protein